MSTYTFATSNSGKSKEINILVMSMGGETIDDRTKSILSDFSVLPLPNPLVYPKNHPLVGASINPPDEPYNSFVENALHKARYYSAALQCAVIAEDSGLCVPSLRGAPGVFSARYYDNEKSRLIAPTINSDFPLEHARPFVSGVFDEVAEKNKTRLNSHQTLDNRALPLHQKTPNGKSGVNPSMSSDEKNWRSLLANLDGIDDRRAFYVCVVVALQSADDPNPIVAQGFWRGEIAHSPAGVGGFGYDPVFYLPQLHKTAAQLTPDEKAALSHRGAAFRLFLNQWININQD